MGGLSDARNVGLKYATGKYISFVDADDFIDVDMYEILYNKIIENNCDIVSCNYNYYFDKNNRVVFNNVFTKEILYFDRELFAKDLFNKYQMDVDVWNKLYKKDIFDRIRFPYKKICESAYIIISIFNNASKILVIPDRLYYYRKRENSIMDKLKNNINIDLIEGRITMATDYKYFYPNIKESNELLFHVYKTAIDSIVLSDERDKYRLYENILLEQFKKLLQNKIPIKFKIGIYKRCLNTDLYRMIKLFGK